MRNLHHILNNTQYVNYHLDFTMYPLRISKMFNLYKDLYIEMQKRHCYSNSQKDHSCAHCNLDLCDDIQSSFLLAHNVTNEMFQLINGFGANGSYSKQQSIEISKDSEKVQAITTFFVYISLQIHATYICDQICYAIDENSAIIKYNVYKNTLLFYEKMRKEIPHLELFLYKQKRIFFKAKIDLNESIKPDAEVFNLIFNDSNFSKKLF